jgi:hypothetical protein
MHMLDRWATYHDEVEALLAERARYQDLKQFDHSPDKLHVDSCTFLL